MKSIKYILGFVAGCMLFSSCAEEVDSPYTKTEVIDGIPVTATLSFDANSASVVSKATAEEEDAITDLYVVVFNASDGTYSSATYFTNVELNEMGRNKIKLNTTSGTKKIYAVANTGSNSFSNGEKNLKDEIDTFLANKPSLSEWLDFSMEMTQEQVTWDGSHGTFTMSGYFVPDADASGLKGDVLPGDGSCTFNLDGTVAVAGKIQLVRVASQIIFNISDASNSKGTFTPTSWAVYNVPKAVYMNRKATEGTPAHTTYFSRTGTFNQGSFNFYMLENRQAAKNTTNDITLGKDQMNWREAYSLTGEIKNYTNAPEYGTYVVLQGTYRGDAKNPFDGGNTGEAQASVTYYIHLGYADGVNDFSIPRNAKYTYNVTVAGVDDIIVEVTTEDNPSNPSDGHVMFYNAEIIEVDAHYERREIEIDCSVNQFICGIETPMTGFVYKDIDDKLTDANKDIDWVYFMLKDVAEKKYNHKINFEDRSKNTELMNVEELTAFVSDAANTGKKDFYVYIAENYYDNLPYEEFVNFEKGIGDAKSRKMMISVERNNKENSSVSSSRYIIQQKPITTIFNLKDNTVSSGNPWGMEWVNENLSKTYTSSTASWKDRAQAGISKSTSNLKSNANDGYANTRSAIGTGGISVDHADIDWGNYPNASNAKAYAACMSRNRDEDGNGKIDYDEIKWYLPASNQMQYLWVGLEAIPEDAALYPEDFRKANQWQFYHHVTSDGQVFWAEEGCAIGAIEDSYASRLHVRCTRNLGTGSQLSIGTKTTETNKDVVVEIGTRLPDGVFRQGLSSGKLSIHNEYGESNKVYRKIQIKNSTLSAKTFKEAADAVYENTTDPCATHGTGWRSPSQREMILMTTVGEFTGTAMHTVTYYSFWDYTNERRLAYNPSGTDRGNTRVGFSYNGSVLHLITPGQDNGSGSSSRAIRCVKDLVD